MNETICNIPTYEAVHSMIINPIILTIICIIYLAPLFIYFIIGITARGRSSSGQVTSKPMICFVNYFYAIITWGIVQGGLFLLLVFPIFLEWFKC
jgi:hypothetical protein